MSEVFTLDPRAVKIRYSTTRPNEASIRCPFCERRKGTPDTGYHMGLELTKGMYHCFRCEAKGRFRDVAELFLLNSGLDAPDLDEMRGRLNKALAGRQSFRVDLDEISYKMDPHGTPIAYEYTKARGYTDEDIAHHQLRVGKPFWNGKREDNRWSGRVLFPFFLNGQCLYVVGRSHTGKDPKYLNSAGPKSIVVYGLDDVNGEAIICEGIISSHSAAKAAGLPAVAILGKNPTTLQLSRLRSRASRVFTSLDADVTEYERAHITKILWAMGFDVWDVPLPLVLDPATGRKLKKDPDDFKDEYHEFFRRAKRVSVV